MRQFLSHSYRTAKTHLSASFAAILNATTPLFTALVAWIWAKELITLKKVIGLILGVIGVAVLVRWDPHESSDRLLIWVSFSLYLQLSHMLWREFIPGDFKGEKPMGHGSRAAAGCQCNYDSVCWSNHPARDPFNHCY